jgi:hypothetical protein
MEEPPETDQQRRMFGRAGSLASNQSFKSADGLTSPIDVTSSWDSSNGSDGKPLLSKSGGRSSSSSLSSFSIPPTPQPPLNQPTAAAAGRSLRRYSSGEKNNEEHHEKQQKHEQKHDPPEERQQQNAKSSRSPNRLGHFASDTKASRQRNAGNINAHPSHNRTTAGGADKSPPRRSIGRRSNSSRESQESPRECVESSIRSESRQSREGSSTYSSTSGDPILKRPSSRRLTKTPTTTATAATEHKSLRPSPQVGAPSDHPISL